VTTDSDSRSEEQTLLAALRTALAEPAEQRLYKSARHPGIFDERGPAPERALHDRLIEIVRTETRGGHTTEWARITPAGVRYLHAHDSPRAVLQELRATLQVSREGLPAWRDAFERQMRELTARLADDMHRLVHRFDALSQRVEEALKKLDAATPALVNGVAQSVSWAGDALTYLDQRVASGAAADCPMPELFAAVREHRPELSLTEFHDGLRRLADYRAVALKPFAGPPERLTEPEYALLEGASVLYFVKKY
jgi:molybdenum-dependent DNA-binding transcriptional regulator ModE